MKKTLFIISLAAIFLFTMCQKENEWKGTPYTLDLPPGFTQPQIPEDNELTVERIALGKALFYDPVLSRDRTISCASCHKQNLAFADDQPISPGVENRMGFRNAPGLANLAWHPYLNKDGGVPNLELQSLVPLEDKHEMDFDAVRAAERLNDIPFYVELSRKAYDRDPDPFVITRALASFERTLISGHSAFDKFIRQGDTTALTDQEKRGWNLFRSQKLACSQCHRGFDLTNYQFESNGLLPDPDDPGRERVTFNPADRGLFKVPSLRNVALTAPYMHDGRFYDLEQVIEHYNRGGENPDVPNPWITPLNLSAQEKADLIAFLHTLTDHNYIQDPDFQPE